MGTDLLSMIYEAPIAERPWEALMPELRRLTRANGVMLKLAPAGLPGAETLFADAEWDCRPTVRQYRQVYQFLDPVRYEGMAVGKCYRFEDLIERDVLERSDFYHWHLRPLNIEHAFFFYVGRHHGMDAWLRGSRSAAQGRFTEEETQAVGRLMGHLGRAVEIYARLEGLRAEAMLYSRAVDAFGVGMVLLDGTGTVLAKNDEARALLGTRSPLLERGQRLMFGPEQSHNLTELLAPLAQDAGQAELMLTVEDTRGDAVRILIRKTDALLATSASNPPAFALYFGRNRTQLPTRMAERVAELLSITPTEARLVVLLAEGRNLRDAAVRMKVTLTTARTYCKRALAKTGTSRQADLVRLALTSLARLS